MQPMYYIGLDVHNRTINYCVKDVSGTCLPDIFGITQFVLAC